MAMDRVALVAWCWFLLWTGMGVAIGTLLETPWTGALLGFFSALLGTLAWPWIMPEAINAWMNQEWSEEWPQSRRTHG
jgi:hypothetical protein